MKRLLWQKRWAQNEDNQWKVMLNRSKEAWTAGPLEGTTLKMRQGKWTGQQTIDQWTSGESKTVNHLLIRLKFKSINSGPLFLEL